MTSSAAPIAAMAPARAATRLASATWFIATILACAAGIVVGLLWDISWHMTVGRDTLFTAPHNLEYASASIAGLTCGFVVLRSTFWGSAEDQQSLVRFWGFRGPMGGWITIWGSLAMAISAPFDDWWHNAYGLDVKIVSPPHMVLLSGMLGIVIGALVLAAAAQNRAKDAQVARDAWGYAVAGGVLVFILACATIEYSWPNAQHGSLYYQVWGAVFPAVLVGYAQAGRLRYPATAAALVFMVLWFAMAQVLRTVEAVPMLAPIWNARTYMWPPYFPAWLIVPAFGIDLVRTRLTRLNPWLAAAVFGVVFVTLHIAAQYPFSIFMLSDASRNAFFNGHEWPYTTRIGPWMSEFWGNDQRRDSVQDTLVFARGAVYAMGGAALSSRLGLAWGGWMSRVQR